MSTGFRTSWVRNLFGRHVDAHPLRIPDTLLDRRRYIYIYALHMCVRMQGAQRSSDANVRDPKVYAQSESFRDEIATTTTTENVDHNARCSHENRQLLK